jgi:methylglyoxal synthase
VRNEKYTIAMIAHDAKKGAMAELVKRYSEKLSQLNLVATRSALSI